MLTVVQREFTKCHRMSTDVGRTVVRTTDLSSPFVMYDLT